jgi:hypothetical protein
MPETKEWTVMFCFASDNPLAPGTISQLKAIKNAGYHPDANVIAQFDPHTVNMPVHVFDVNMVEKTKHPGEANIGFARNDSFVRNLVLDKLWDEDVKKLIRKKLCPPDAAEQLQNGSDPHIKYDPPVPTRTMSREQNPKESLATFLNFCRIHYPARHYMLFILAHGVVVGNDLFMLDEHGAEDDDSPPRSLLLTDLSDVLDKFKDKIAGDKEPGKLELIAFHSCSMSGAEVGLELKGKASYMLASQGPTFVDSWPYRQILIRLFNELGSTRELSDKAIVQGLIEKVRTGTDSTSMYLRNRFIRNGGKLPPHKLVEVLTDESQGVFNDAKLCQVEAFQNGYLSRDLKRLMAAHRKKPFRGDSLQRLNRLLLMEAYPEEIKKVRIRRMFINIFEYCMYNSFDFQIAGYSCDLTLCDLHKVDRIQAPLEKLTSTLSNALENPTAREAMLLAHWEAQSFYEEKYTDLYDFCFRLKAKCQDYTSTSKATKDILEHITSACDFLMKVLKRGFRNDDYGAIVRCEFSGPMYQYAHGLSIFFPWSEPIGSRMWDREYEQYELSQRTGWREFLKKYFNETMRCTQAEEKDPLDQRWQRRPNLDRDLLEILESVATRVFSEEGQLGRGGPLDPLGGGKGGGLDPAGGGCDCGSIKNYPPVTQRPPMVATKGSKLKYSNAQSYPALASPDILEQVTNQLSDTE